MPAEVVDPAFGRELAHERVDEGEARLAVLPALKPCFGEGRVDGVGRWRLAGQACGRLDVVG